MSGSPKTSQNINLACARQVLADHWTFPSFREGQARAVESVLNREDVLLLMPTGGGKSICYQVPAIALEGFGLVISPLVALMQDQVESLGRLGVSAAYINSTLSYHEIEQRWINAEHGMYDLVYMAPERLDSDLFKARLGRLNVNLVAVDEAHCVSEWGHHFRPAYLNIANAIEELGSPPCIAVTATATPEVRRDIVTQLRLKDATKIVRGFDRANLVWTVFNEVNKKQKLRQIVENVPGSGIVYVATRRSSERWAAWLKEESVSARSYHGGMGSSIREEVQHQWIGGDVRIVVATNAFGMGIDKPDVRFVVHVELPASLESYYQEAGRAGRDGGKAYAVLLYQPPDADTQQYLIESGHPDKDDAVAVYEAICNLAQVPLQETPEDPIAVNLPGVQRITDLSRPKIQNAISLLEQQGFWEEMPQRKGVGHVRFTQDAEDIRGAAESHSNRAVGHFIQYLLRAVHADAFVGWWPLHVKSIARKMDFPKDRLVKGLEFLAARGMLEWMGPEDVARLYLRRPRTKRPRIDDRAVQKARKQAEKRLNYLLQYTQTRMCRRKFLLNYFGESAPDKCDNCDRCLGRHTAVDITPSDERHLVKILEAANRHEQRSSWELDVSSYRLDAYLDWLTSGGYLEHLMAIEASYQVTEKGRMLLERWKPTS